MDIQTSIKWRRQKATSQKTRQTLSRLQSLQEEVQALKRQVAQMEKVLEVRQEVQSTYRVPQSLAELKPRRLPAASKTAMEMIQDQWPGEETTEELLAQLKELG